MATHTAVTAQHATLSAATMDTVTVTGDGLFAVIMNRSTTAGAVLYATINGPDPTVGADDTLAVPAGVTRVEPVASGIADTVFKLISATADAYTVALTNNPSAYTGGGAATGGVAPGAGENHIGEVGGRVVVVASTFTRPADTTAYTAKDVVADSTSAATIRTFAGAARVSGGSGYITKAQLLTDQSANTARFRLHLYNTSSPTVLNDNAPNTVLYANAGKYVGWIDFDACTTETGSSVAQALNSTVRLAYTTSGNDTLYGVLEAVDAFTPASGQQFTIRLAFDQN